MGNAALTSYRKEDWPQRPELFEQCEEMVEAEPEAMREFLSEWPPSKYEFADQDWFVPPQGPVMRRLATHPAVADLIAERLRTCMENGPELVRHWAFTVARDHPKSLGPYEEDFPGLVALGIFSTEFRRSPWWAVERLDELVELEIGEPAALFAALETAFQIDNATAWRKAAAPMRSMRKKDRTLTLADPERVHELIERDPDKHGKIFEGLTN